MSSDNLSRTSFVDVSGEAGRGDMVDQASHRFVSDTISAISKHLRMTGTADFLEQEAFFKLPPHRRGYCVDCHEKISLARMKAKWFATRCIECAERKA